MLRFNCLQPPFDDPAMRRAVRLAIRQPDYMQAAFGDAPGMWAACTCLWPRHTPHYSEADAGMMPGDTEAARSALAAAGYRGEPVVVLTASDRPVENPVANVTAALLHEIGMNVDLQAMGFATMIHRRTSREPPAKGGWNIFHAATVTASTCGSPATSFVIRGQARGG